MVCVTKIKCESCCFGFVAQNVLSCYSGFSRKGQIYVANKITLGSFVLILSVAVKQSLLLIIKGAA